MFVTRWKIYEILTMNWTFVEAKWKNPASGTCGGYIIHSSELYYDRKLTVGNGLLFVMSNVKSVAYCGEKCQFIFELCSHYRNKFSLTQSLSALNLVRMSLLLIEKKPELSCFLVDSETVVIILCLVK